MRIGGVFRRISADFGVFRSLGVFPVTLNSEMDFYLRNGRNEDFFTKWSYKIQFYSLSGEIFYLNVKVSHISFYRTISGILSIFASIFRQFGAFFLYEMEF